MGDVIPFPTDRRQRQIEAAKKLEAALWAPEYVTGSDGFFAVRLRPDVEAAQASLNITITSWTGMGEPTVVVT